MKYFVRVVKMGDGIISFLSLILCILVLLYSCYCLWDNYTGLNGALPEKLERFKPVVNEESGNEVISKSGLDELHDINNDIIGWLNIYDTKIDYPFVKSSDDRDYLSLNIYKDYSISGSIFMSMNNTINDNYIILYGHHMQNQTMFGSIDNFLDKNYFDSHLNGSLYTLDKNYDFKVMAVMKVYAGDPIVYYNGNLSSLDFSGLKEYIKSNAINYNDIGDINKIVLMSTCSDGINDRLVLVGSLIER